MTCLAMQCPFSFSRVGIADRLLESTRCYPDLGVSPLAGKGGGSSSCVDDGAALILDVSAFLRVLLPPLGKSIAFLYKGSSGYEGPPVE